MRFSMMRRQWNNTTFINKIHFLWRKLRFLTTRSFCLGVIVITSLIIVVVVIVVVSHFSIPIILESKKIGKSGNCARKVFHVISNHYISFFISFYIISYHFASFQIIIMSKKIGIISKMIGIFSKIIWKNVGIISKKIGTISKKIGFISKKFGISFCIILVHFVSFWSSYTRGQGSQFFESCFVPKGTRRPI